MGQKRGCFLFWYLLQKFSNELIQFTKFILNYTQRVQILSARYYINLGLQRDSVKIQHPLLTPKNQAPNWLLEPYFRSASLQKTIQFGHCKFTNNTQCAGSWLLQLLLGGKNDRHCLLHLHHVLYLNASLCLAESHHLADHCWVGLRILINRFV